MKRSCCLWLTLVTIIVLFLSTLLVKCGATCAGNCGKHGTCEGNVCKCSGGWTGQNCDEDINECDIPNLCQNNGSCVNAQGSYSCNCMAGFTRKNCSENIDDCEVSVGQQPKCKNNGSCMDGIGKFICICTEYYKGLECEYIDECMLDGFCHANNTIKCVSDWEGKGLCTCKSGFEGRNCSEDIDECKDGNPNSCSAYSHCENTVGSYKCVCDHGYKGQFCDRMAKCDSSPCKNGGTCASTRGTQAPTCFCPHGYKGAYCEEVKNFCKSFPCKNNAQCVSKTGYYECKCHPGYHGKNCETKCALGYTGADCSISINDCVNMNVVCQNNGSCVDGINNYTCVCSPGFTGKLCEHEVNECNENPCKNGGNCTNTFGSYRCACRKGYTGTNCEKNVNDCAQVKCLNGGICKDELNNYTCVCHHPGFTGRNCEINIDECQSRPCLNGGQCVDGIASYTCVCPAHKTGQNCEVNVDNCLNHHCKNGATCESKADDYSCACKAGYTGKYCDKEVNECVPSPCVRGTCKDRFNNYKCQCPMGFTGKDCEKTIDYCKNEGQSCFNNGTCVNRKDGFFCQCPNGFSGQRCQNLVDQCLSKPCQNGATCVNGIGNYSCYCRFGYEGRNCEHKIDWCSPARNPCKNGARCLLEISESLANHFNCKCVGNFTGKICDMESLNRCDDVRAANGSEPVCKNGGTCVPRNTYYTCRCPAGFTGSHCETNINDCQSGPCKNGATCVDQVAGYGCRCFPGFTGATCETNINECSSNPCVHGKCYDLINMFHCGCYTGYTGKHCEFNPNDCAPDACLNNGTCSDGIGEFNCKCPAGFDGKRCEEDVNECLSNPCSATGTDYCVNLVNDYKCKCKRGYAKRDCSFDINECLSNPCQNGGSCRDKPGTFVCECPYGYSGLRCEIRVHSCRDKPCQNEGECRTPGDGYKCVCKPGVSGIHCEMNNDECASSPCRNEGMCVDSYNDYTCDCAPGYRGKQCEEKVQCEQTVCGNGGKPVANYGGTCRCQCLDGFSGESCEKENRCPHKDCSNKFSVNVNCSMHRCNVKECDFAGLSCSLNLHPWKQCKNESCVAVFANKECDPACDTKECLFDAFDCREQLSPCSDTSRCAKSMFDGTCDEQCNTESCGYDGLDCDNTEPQFIDGVLKIWLRMKYYDFQSQRNLYLLNMSRLLRAVVTIETVDGLEKVEPVVIARRRRSADAVKRYKRGSGDDQGTKVNLKVDKRKCVGHCFTTMEEVANYMGGLKSKNQDLPGNPFKIETGENSDVPRSTPFKPLWIAIICVSLPLIAVGVVASGKRVLAKLWLPEGFPSRPLKRRSQRHDPVGEDSEDKSSIGKSSTCGGSGDDDYADQTRHSGRAPKRLKLISDDGPLRIANPKDARQWTALHREVADVNNRTISSLSVLTPPQEGQDCSAAQSDVNAIGPGGLTPLMVAVTRGNYLDGTLEDDKDSDDSSGQVVGELIQFGARIESTSDDSRETALHLAARHARADAARRLLDAGADANAKDRTGRTPLHLAVTADAQGVFQILLRHRATHLDEPSDDGTTPLIYAARFMVDDMVEDLIKAGGKVNLADKQGKTALHWAASVDNEKAAALLLKNNAKRDAQDAKGQTPLFLASKEGSASVVKLLLSSFANRKLADNMDQSPLDVAKLRDHADIAKLLSDWSIGCKSPTAAPIPTSPGGEMSPLASRTLSPPDVQPKTNRTRTQSSNDAQKQTRKKRRKSRSDNDNVVAVAMVSSTSPPSVPTVNGTSPQQGLSPFSSNSYGSSLSPSNSTFSPPLRHMDNMPSPLRDSDPLHNGVPGASFYAMPDEMACYGNSLNGAIPEFMNIENTVDINDLWLLDASTEQNKDCMYGSQYPPGNVILSSGLDNNIRYYGMDRRTHGMPAKTCVRSPSELTAWNSLCGSNGTIKHNLPTVATVDTRRRPRNQDCQYPSPPYELSPASPHENQWSSSSSSRASNSDCSTC